MQDGSYHERYVTKEDIGVYSEDTEDARLALIGIDNDKVARTYLEYAPSSNEQMSKILSNQNYTDIQFAEIQTYELMNPDLFDDMIVGDSLSFGEFNIKEPEFKKINSETVRWSGSVSDLDDQYPESGNAVILVTPEGASGFITRHGKVYDVVPVDSTVHAIVEKIIPTESPIDIDDVYIQSDGKTLEEHLSQDFSIEEISGDISNPIIDETNPTVSQCKQNDTTHMVEIVAGYTREAAIKSRENAKRIDHQVIIAAEVGNTSFEKSKISAELHISDLIILDQYEQAKSGRFIKEIVDMRNQVDQLKPLFDLRKEKKADVMLLIVHRDGTERCGMANIIKAKADEAFAVVNWQCMAEYMSFSHEIGHLIGAWHNPEVLRDKTIKKPPYAHGFTHSDADSLRSFSTIMGYPHSCNPNCGRTMFWSNPNIIDPNSGKTTGTINHNNACVWNNGVREMSLFGESL